MFYQSEELDLAVAQIPKCGINSIREWLGYDFQIVKNDEVTVSRRVAFIRHPIERLKSAYSFIYWKQTRWSREELEKKGRFVPTDSWETFVDFTLENDNEHWNPQAEMVGDTPNIWHKFENINEHWEKYKPGILGHENRASRLDTNEYRMDELLEKYAKDLERWETAT